MPRARTLLRAGIALAGAAIVAGGCGGGGTAGEPKTTATVDRPTLPVRIDRPRQDAVVPAARRVGRRLGVKLTVSGRADAAQTIEVAVSCAERACSKAVFSDGAGDWSADFDVLLPPRRHRLAITAGYPVTEAAAARPIVRVSVRGPKTPAASRPRRRSRRRSPQSGSPTTTTPPPTTSAPTPAPAPAPPTTAQAPTVPPVTTSPAPNPGASRHALVLIGDSLAVGVQSLLPSLLPGWRVTVDGRVGRPLAEGMGIIAQTALPSDGATVLAVSLFTNDDPTHTAQLQAAVRSTLERVGSRG